MFFNVIKKLFRKVYFKTQNPNNLDWSAAETLFAGLFLARSIFLVKSSLVISGSSSTTLSFFTPYAFKIADSLDISDGSISKLIV